jgi:hypothetical protein
MRFSSIFSYAKDDYKRFIHLINNKNYSFRATLINPKRLYIDLQKSAILELDIEDNVYNPFFDGHIIIDNTENVIERFKTDPSLTEFGNQTVFQGYRTRGDGRDILLLSILPVEGGEDGYNLGSDSFNEIFGLQAMFVLTDEEDLTTDTGKSKKYRIKDFDYQILNERKLFFSSVSILGKTVDVSNLTDSEKSVPTGKIIKEILKKALSNDEIIYKEKINGVETTPHFEDGCSTLFYSSPAENSALDDLSFIYSLHVSDNIKKDFAFLNKTQFTGEYTLESASSIFKKSFNKKLDSGGQYFIENFTMAGQRDVNNIIQNDVKKPLNALEFGETGDIIDVKFFNPPGGEYQNKLKTNLVHSYNFEGKKFIIDSISGNIENVKEDFTELYVNPMKGKDEPKPYFLLNNTQKANLNYDNVFTIFDKDNDFIRLSVGRNKILKDALKLNLGVELTVQGGLHRHAGKFISIDRTGSYIENDFDSKFMGIYFILSVKHIFIKDITYLNKIVAVKTYSFTDLKNEENIT